MEYLQYYPAIGGWSGCQNVESFKPYYKWNTFNTLVNNIIYLFTSFVLNLIINGIPSILHYKHLVYLHNLCFKPYYKWNTFNTFTYRKSLYRETYNVLNLIINGIPSIP